MTTSRGFSRGDFDTSFPLDERFLKIAKRLAPSRYLQAVGAYWLVVAAAWRDARRPVVEDFAVGVDPRVVEALVEVGLLDAEHRLAESSYEHWIGKALARRRADADRPRKVIPPDSTGIRRNPKARSARARRDGTGQVVTGTEGGAGETDDLWRLYQGLTKTAHLKPNVIDWLTRLEAAHGAAATAEAMTAELTADPNVGTLLSRTATRLEAAARKRENGEAAMARSNAIYEGMLARRLELFRQTGEWQAEWGPRPELTP